MNDLSVQYNNGTQNADSPAAPGSEFDALQSEITRITENANCNGVSRFGGSALTFQVGSTNTGTIDVSARALAAVDTSAADITDSSTIQAAITTISTQRAELGAVQNRFEHTIASTTVAIANLFASESRIRATDVAPEMVDVTRSNILSQAGTSTLAQANSAPPSGLQLLRG